jgi:dynein assembly factor with WDR repeat domains 1
MNVLQSLCDFFLTFVYCDLRTDIDRLIDQILLEEPLISEARKPQLKKLIEKLIEKQQENQMQRFGLAKVLRAHLLPLTNCAFNKSGSKFITGSYDRTCKVWDTNSGQELLSLDEHTNVVYTMAFNNPYG